MQRGVCFLATLQFCKTKTKQENVYLEKLLMVLLKENQVGLAYKTNYEVLFLILWCSVSVFSSFQGNTYWKKSVNWAASQVSFKWVKLLWRRVSLSVSISKFALCPKKVIRKRDGRNGSGSPQINEGNFLPLENIHSYIHL